MLLLLLLLPIAGHGNAHRTRGRPKPNRIGWARMRTNSLLVRPNGRLLVGHAGTGDGRGTVKVAKFVVDLRVPQPQGLGRRTADRRWCAARVQLFFATITLTCGASHLAAAIKVLLDDLWYHTRWLASVLTNR